MPQKQPKRRRLWLNDGARVRLRPQYKDHVWSCDFVADRTSDGRSFRMLTLIDEHTRECLAIDVARNLKSEDVLERLSELFNGELFDTLLEAKVLVERGWPGGRLNTNLNTGTYRGGRSHEELKPIVGRHLDFADGGFCQIE